MEIERLILGERVPPDAAALLLRRSKKQYKQRLREIKAGALPYNPANWTQPTSARL